MFFVLASVTLSIKQCWLKFYKVMIVLKINLTSRHCTDYRIPFQGVYCISFYAYLLVQSIDSRAHEEIRNKMRIAPLSYAAEPSCARISKPKEKLDDVQLSTYTLKRTVQNLRSTLYGFLSFISAPFLLEKTAFVVGDQWFCFRCGGKNYIEAEMDIRR